MASLKGNHFLDFPAHIQKWNAIDRSRVDPNNPYGEGPSWANQINTMVWGTGGLDPAAIFSPSSPKVRPMSAGIFISPLAPTDIFKSVSTRVELPDGSKQYAKTINNEPDKFFTKDILAQIDKAAKKEFLYGTE